MRCVDYVLPLLFTLACSNVACSNAPAPVIETHPVIEEPPVEVTPVPLAPRERLERGARFEVEGDASAVHLMVAHAMQSEEIDPVIANGELGVHASGASFTASPLTIALHDIESAPETFPPNGLHLTDIRATIALSGMNIAWQDESTASFDGNAKVRVEWSLQKEDGTLAIRPLELTNIPLEGTIALGDDIAIAISMNAPGVVFEVANLAQLSDLSLSLLLRESRRREASSRAAE